MNRHVIFHLDPLDDTRGMVILRLRYYLSFAKTLSAQGWTCDFVGLEKHAATLRDEACFRQCHGLPEIIYPWDWYGQYHLLAHNQALPQSLLDVMDGIYAGLPPDKAIWVTNTPSSLLKRHRPQSLVLHYEFGLFSRAPFPEYHQLDPWGYSHKSLLSRYPILGLPTSEAHIKQLKGMVEDVNRRAGIEAHRCGSVSAIHLPLQSQANWPMRLESQLSRGHMIEQVLRLHSQVPLIVTQKSGHRLSDEERTLLNSYPQAHVLDDQGISLGSFQTAYCKATYTTSPSLTLQTIFWKNQVLTSHNSSMANWKFADREQAFQVLASYVGNFTVVNEHDLERVIINGWTLHQSHGAL
jgi:hypothetical protein